MTDEKTFFEANLLTIAASGRADSCCSDGFGRLPILTGRAPRSRISVEN
jgi:hypothetical protein